MIALYIFQNKTHELIEAFGVHPNFYFELIELGAGDGTKTKELLKVLDQENYNFDDKHKFLIYESLFKKNISDKESFFINESFSVIDSSIIDLSFTFFFSIFQISTGWSSA